MPDRSSQNSSDAPAGDALKLLHDWPAGQRVMLLHSGRYHPRWASHSILAQPAGSYQFTTEGQSRWISDALPCPVQQWTHKPFKDLRMLLAATRGQGLWIGYLGYDLARWNEVLPSHAVNDRDWPVIELAFCPHWQKLSTGSGDGFVADARAQASQPWQLRRAPVSVFTRQQYEQTVQRVRDYIAQGDVFQVNLAQRFSAEGKGNPRALFQRLAQTSPAWYGAYLELCDGRRLASTSPELFLQLEPTGRVVTRPIKGTRPASDPVNNLRNSAKDIAELNMIVDLLRNDLGRVCAYGSIRVEQPREIETHPTVHHGVATISGQLHPSRDIVDLLRATMPGGSITGAPKIRAMQIIDELEPVRRGPYCGAIGWITAEALCLNIAIRTLQLTPGGSATLSHGERGFSEPSPVNDTYTIDFSVGGGIVADSDPASEYEETLTKAQALFKALGQTKDGVGT